MRKFRGQLYPLLLMCAKKTSKLQKLLFTEEQIRNKAYQIWQQYPERSSEENWAAALEALKCERQFRSKNSFWQWTGFGEKKLWDFLQLLIVPLTLAFAGYIFQDFSKQREQQVAADKAQQETLFKYFDQMAELIKKDNLLNAKSDAKTFIIAQIRTVTALQSLNPERQMAVLQFLRTANLYNPSGQIDSSSLAQSQKIDNAPQKVPHGLLHEAHMPLINLRKAELAYVDLSHADPANADLSGAYLIYADLSYAYLIYAYFIDADLSDANLDGANLSDANLDGADLKGANLKGANLSKAINLSSQQVQQAKNWKKAQYIPEFRKKLGLDAEP